MGQNVTQSPGRAREIDGLRAIALFGVLLYHCRLGLLPGGFLGVDIFFVISGFVITLSLCHRLSIQKYSLSQYIQRRILRLTPALLSVLFIANILSSCIFTLEHRVNAAKTAISSVFSISNFYFWVTSDYFDDDAILKPFLHTWSLGLECQFYLVWALLITLIWRFKSKLLQLATIGALFFTSLMLCQVYNSLHPNATFFLLPFRFGEFMLGAFPAWATFHLKYASLPSIQPEVQCDKKDTTFNTIFSSTLPYLNQVISTLSFSTICLYFTFFSNTVTFPGLSAIPVCLCTALIIVTSQNTFVGRCLTSAPLQWLGTISYSVYLCHWTLLVLVDYVLTSKSTEIHRVLAILFSIACGHILYHLVELPFQNSNSSVLKHLSMPTKLKMCLVGVIIVLVQSLCMITASRFDLSQLFQSREHPEEWNQGELVKQSRLRSDKRTAEIRWTGPVICYQQLWRSEPTEDRYNECNPVGPSIALIGDSHAADFYKPLSTAFKSKLHVLQMTSSGCRLDRQWLSDKNSPKTNLLPNLQEYCRNMYRFIPRILTARSANISAAVLVSQWTRPVVGYEEFAILNETISLLTSFGTGVYVIGPRPIYSISPFRILSQKNFEDRESFQKVMIQNRRIPSMRLEETLRAVVEAKGGHYISIMPTLCGKANPPLHNCKVIHNGSLIYADKDHFNSEGANLLASKVLLGKIQQDMRRKRKL